MTCCGQLDGTRFLPCLRAVFNLPSLRSGPGGTDNVWDQAAHTALYRALSTDAALQESRGQTAAEIAAVAWGSEPEVTGGYVMAYAPKYVGSASGDIGPDVFWGCLGVSKENAVAQLRAESGDYWDVALEAGDTVSITEGGSALSGMAWYWWALIGLGTLGAGYLVYKYVL